MLHSTQLQNKVSVAIPLSSVLANNRVNSIFATTVNKLKVLHNAEDDNYLAQVVDYTPTIFHILTLILSYHMARSFHINCAHDEDVRLRTVNF